MRIQKTHHKYRKIFKVYSDNGYFQGFVEEKTNSQFEFLLGSNSPFTCMYGAQGFTDKEQAAQALMETHLEILRECRHQNRKK